MTKIDTVRTRTFALLVLFCLASHARAARTDVVVRENGDAVAGEIKSLDFGELSSSTDSMGTVSIEWEEVQSLERDQALQIEITTGTRYFGNLVPASREGMLAVGRGENVTELEILNIGRITPIDTDERFWQRMEGSVSFGFDIELLD